MIVIIIENKLQFPYVVLVLYEQHTAADALLQYTILHKKYTVALNLSMRHEHTTRVVLSSFLFNTTFNLDDQ